MSTALAAWLTEHHDAVLERWSAAIVAARTSNGHRVATDTQGGVVVQSAPPLTAAALAPIYHALIDATRGDHVNLREQLYAMVQLEQAGIPLPELLQFSFQLRRTTWEVMRENGLQPEQQFTLMADLETVLEQSVAYISQFWADQVDSAMQERMQEVTFLTERMATAVEEADRTAVNLTALNDTAARLAACMEHADPDEVLEVVSAQIMSLFEPQHLSVWLDDTPRSGETATRLLVLRVWGASVPELAQVQLNLTTAGTDAGEDPVLRAYLLGETVLELEPTADTHPRWQWHLPDHGIVAVPLIAHDRANGVVLVQASNAAAQFTLARQKLLIGLVSQLAIALDNVRLYQQVLSFNTDLNQLVEQRSGELAAEKERLQALQEISLEVSSSLDVDVLLKSSLHALADIVRAPYGSIMLVDRETDQLESRAVLGFPEVDTYVRFPMGDGVAGWVAFNKKPALIPDVTTDERWVMRPNQQMTGKQGGSMVAVPLIAHQEVLGVLTLSHTERDYFNADHLRLLTAAAGTIAVGVYNANLYTTIASTVAERSDALQRQRAESTHITSIMQSLTDGVIVCDIYGAVQLVNLATERLLMRPIEELLLQNLDDILRSLLTTRRDDLPLQDLLDRALDSEGAPRIFETIIEQHNLILNLKLSPVLSGEDDEMIGAILTIRDTTREAVADRLKTEFISTMSHELRTPMTAIKGFTQLMVMGNLGPLSETQMELMTTIQQNSERMIAIINDVLELTKIESGEIDLHMRPIHMAEALSGVMTDLAPRSAQRSHNLTLGIPPGLPLVLADATQLHKILYNLVSNAIKYTPEGGTVTVDAHEVQLADLPLKVRDRILADRTYLQINVRDTGVGISAEDQERIFDRFYRTENSLKIEAGGTGLGLSLARPLINLMGGEIWVESTLGEGSTFSFVLYAASHRI